MTPVLCVTAIALAALLMTRATRPAGFIDWLLFLTPIVSGLILIAGYVLSALNLLGSIQAWALMAGALLLVAAIVQPVGQADITLLFRSWSSRLRRFTGRLANGYAGLTWFEKRLLVPCILVVAGLGAVNLVLVVSAAPHSWDSMTYHLARMAYYLQHGNLANFDANFWAQVVHPKNSTLLVSFAYLASGRNENVTQLVQYVSYWIAIVSVYGISRRIGSDRFSSLFAGLVFALLTECLMQATTTQNDLLITACVGCAVYGLLAWRQSRARKYLVLAAMTSAIGLGVKASMLLVLPSLAVLTVFVAIDLHRSTADAVGGGQTQAIRGHRMRDIGGDLSVFLLSAAVATALFVLPAGYGENWREFGHPIGPAQVRALHSFEGQSAGYILKNGARNMLRFGFDFVSLDGMPSRFAAAQAWFRRPLQELTLAAGIDLETAEATIAPFTYARPPTAYDDGSYWGILGFGLIWPVVVLSLLGTIHSVPGRVLSFAALLFFVVQSYAGPYDPWRGRYFMVAAVFALPVVSVWIGRRHRWPVRAYVTAIVLLGCVSGLAAVRSPISEVYRRDRIGQLTTKNRAYAEPVRRFERLVPANATVAVLFGAEAFEYPLFGEGLTRVLIPVNGFQHGLQPVPSEAEYLIYSAEIFTDRRASDIHLGEDWYLRALKKDLE